MSRQKLTDVASPAHHAPTSDSTPATPGQYQCQCVTGARRESMHVTWHGSLVDLGWVGRGEGGRPGVRVWPALHVTLSQLAVH